MEGESKMTRILAIDSGTTESAYVVFDGATQPRRKKEQYSSESNTRMILIA